MISALTTIASTKHNTIRTEMIERGLWDRNSNDVAEASPKSRGAYSRCLMSFNDYREYIAAAKMPDGTESEERL